MELVVVISIIGITTVVAAPSFQQWRGKQLFEADTRQVLSLLADIRAAAFADKNCAGEQSRRWMAQFETTGMMLRCEQLDGGLETVASFPWESEAIVSFQKSTNGTYWPTESPMEVSIFSGGTQSRIGSLYENKWARIELDFVAAGKKSTVCFSRIANYPFLSSSGLCDDD